MGGRFWWASSFEGPKRGYPPKKNQDFFVKSLVKISASFAWPFGRDNCSKKSVGQFDPPQGRKG